MKNIDTIIAKATPSGRGSIGVIRISGVHTLHVIKYVLKINSLKPRYANYLPFFYKHKIIDKGIALWFPKPYSYTGEDVLELHCHGNNILLDLLINNIINNISHIRIAKPGEFTERAFLNNKIDLTQAEAISDIINADCKSAIFSAMNLMNGYLSKFFKPFNKQIINIRTKIESLIEFSFHHSDVIYQKIFIKLQILLQDSKKIVEYLKYNLKTQEGIKIILVGPTNSGKSSLINFLSGKDVSIITDIPGTTRDIIYEHIYIESIPIKIIDTAGIRKTNNYIENIGINKALKEISMANYVFLVVEDNINKQKLYEIKNYLQKFIKNNTPIIIIRNKIDITKKQPEIIKNDNIISIRISIHTKQGLSLLKDFISNNIIPHNNTEDEFTSKQRYIDSFNKIYNFLQDCLQKCYSKKYINLELISENLRLIQIELDVITGKFTSQNLLDHIFSQFCIGK
ncbi:tRNA uridine-5-carboxymethylaminomethyl(34) synthesis GTPase MnmE [Enterobacteriaceae endosymbiont of Neohaemonia nigricornis]|uniref:tRNA uridine-5-carboxymethylaminomethyl(34) synthesis GTPase MnmE n=1 Tax=Enterobacteriaceae endosymbiont of Neohaemonia nigricornis TaxID=2675792 RepID=UPI001ABF1CC6|nr:tRNA uridine-5-carboxymethylaminomethyl(34) synthesis GTPase MnmE [Enterobacteriaceae endosymbiont of Neohaemonia nigricornis]